MKSHQRRAAQVNENNIDMFNWEVQKVHRELKNELERLKLEKKINQHISKILERRLTEFENSIEV